MESALFLLTGVTITTLTIVLYLGFIHLLALTPPIAATLAFICVTPPHFLAYSKFVFKSDTDKGTYWRYGFALLISFFLNVFVLSFFWAYLLADPLPAQLLGIIVAVVSSYLLLKFFVFRHGIDWGHDSRAQIALNIVALIIGFLAVYISFLVIALYTAPELFNDDWRHYHDYFLDKSYLAALLDRQNGHLMIFPNFVLYHNYTFFGGHMSTLAVVNLTLHAIAGGGVGYSLYRLAVQRGFGTSTAFVLLMCGLVTFYLLTAPNAQFWGLPLHNHAVIAAAVLSLLFVSGTLGSLDRPYVFVGWFAFALIAAGSFSTGASVAVMGGVGAILNRVGWKYLLAYALAGLIMAVISLGIGAQGKEMGATDMGHILDVLRLIRFELAMLGAPILLITEPSTRDAAFEQSVRVGLAGLFLYVPVGLYVLRSMWRGRYVAKAQNVHFAAFMLASIAIMLPAQIYVARVETFGDQVAIAPRFATWGALFWYGLIWSYAVFAVQLASRTSLFRLLPSMGALLFGAFAVWFNLKVVEERLASQIRFHQDRSTQIAINGADRSTRDNLWLPGSNIPQKVIAHLRDNRRNLYAQDWIWQQGQPFDLSRLDGRALCGGMVRFRTTMRADEFTVEGWAFRTEEQSGTLHHVYVVDPDGVVTGHARPTFGRAHKKGLYYESLPPTFRRLQSVPVGVFPTMPGISGYMFGNMRLETALPDELAPRQDIDLPGHTFVGVDARGQVCRIMDPRKIGK